MSTLRDVVLKYIRKTYKGEIEYRSDRGENGMEYSVIGSASEKGGASS